MLSQNIQGEVMSTEDFCWLFLSFIRETGALFAR